ncbi:MAG: hypothetical protein H7Z11_03635 [Verrucomicrobia bacterium]|nr:hypothetical protein [Leptolyngbya sp. ES-bin-22]
MFRTALSLLCAVAVLAPAAAFANDRDYRGFSRPNDNRYRYPERVRTIEFYNRNRAFDRRDERKWERRDAERARQWRDRRDYNRDRRDDRFRRDYDRDRYDRPGIIIIPRISF